MRILIILLLSTIALTFSGLRHKENFIEWSAERPLQWEDFKGKPEKISSYNALTNSGITYSTELVDGKYVFTVSCHFDCNSSWVKKGFDNDQLLNHEQGHFDITEVYARKLRKEFEATTFTQKNIEKESKGIFNRIFSESKKEQQLYDKETAHSKMADKQKEWESKILANLITLEKYKEIQ